MTERLATERWINEGGHLAPAPVIERELRAAARRRGRARPRVLIAGAGVAGLETLLALRALAGDRVDITLIAPELRFVNRSMAVDQPFRTQRRRGIRLQDVTAEHDARWHRGALNRVEHQRRIVVTKDGHELPYDTLVLALGARPDREWHADGLLTFRDGRDKEGCRVTCGVDATAAGNAPVGVGVDEAAASAGEAIKQGGLAAQQADAVAEAIAASVGADIDPQPFRPVLRGVLLTGAAPCYLRADISGCAGDDSAISEHAHPLERSA